MSLQVWLPLNGDLHNQGLSDVTVTNNGATVNTSGKIGKCYSFDGSNSCIELNAPSLYNIIKGGNQPFTIMFWIYHAAASRGIIFGDYGLTGTIQCNVELQSNHRVRFYWAGAPDKNFSTSVGENTWCHIALVYDGSQVIIYKNGVLQIGDSYSGTLTTKSKTTGVYHLGRDYRNETNLNGKINDVRIYDHALSAKEVEEIAKGLVLHYKLDNNGLGGENLALSTASKIVTATATGTDVSAVTTLDYGLLTNWSRIRGQTITISCDIELINAVNTTGVSNYRVGIEPALKFTDNTTGYYGIWIGLNSTPKTISQRYTKSITLPDKDIQSVLQNGMYIQHLTNGSATIKNIKVELGSVATRWSPAPADLGLDTSIIYDSSGYNNNGYITGTININSGGPKYSSFSQLSVAATISHSRCLDNSNQEWTCVAWVKPTTAGSYQNLNNFNGNNRLYHGTYPLLYLNSGANDYYNYGNMALPANEWSHIAFVFKNSTGTKLIYINGENHTNMNGPNKTSTPVGIPDTVIIGGSYEGGLCDYREYATALTPEQIKELYNTSMSIDDKGNIHARELVEL